MSRVNQPSRYYSVNVKLTHKNAAGEQPIIATYGLTPDGRVRAVFCASFKEGSEQNATAMDGCKLLSLLLQHGYSPQQLLDKLEGDSRSVLGTIMQGAVEIEDGKDL